MRLTIEKPLLWIILQSLWVCSIKSNQDRAVPGLPRIPFQLRFPISDYSKLTENNIQSIRAPLSNMRSGNSSVDVINSTRTLIASASLINPVGFDFTKLILPVKRDQSYDDLKVIPLLWVDLPHLDKPLFVDYGEAQQKKQQEYLNKHDKKDRGNRDNSNFIIRETGSARIYREKEGNKLSKDLQEKQNWSRRINDNSENQQQIDRSRRISSGEPFPAESKYQAIQSPKSTYLRYANNEKDRSADANFKPSNPSEYNFSYSVSDSSTQDVKSHSENRKGDIVRGEYSVLEPDGYTRVVTYIADAGGFKATVKRIPPR